MAKKQKKRWIVPAGQPLTPLDTRILELQDKKKLLNDKLIDSKELDSNIISTLTEKEIRYLLQYENKEN